MGYLVFFTATGLTAKFIYTFLYLFFNVTVWEGWPGKHREGISAQKLIESQQAERSESPFLQQYSNLSDGFVETLTDDGAMLNNAGWKTY